MLGFLAELKKRKLLSSVFFNKLEGKRKTEQKNQNWKFLPGVDYDVEEEAYEVNYLEKCFLKDINIVSRKIADEIILVPIRQNVGDLNSIYTLNEVGVRIWELIDGQRKIKKIKEILVKEFEVSAQEAEKDLIEYLQQLEKVGAITKG